MAGNPSGAAVIGSDIADAVHASNLADAACMLDVLAADTAFTFQTFGEGRSGRERLSKILHGNLEQHAGELARLNAAGAGVFVMVNEGDGRGRKAGNVRAVRALFVDLDGEPLAPVESAALAPHLITQTSPGRFHAYWRVTGCALGDFTPMQCALAAKFKGDPSVKDLPRVMRLAGFLHHKAAPFQSRIRTSNERAPYTLAELRLAFGLDALASAARTSQRTRVNSDAPIPQGSRNDTLLSHAAMFRNRGTSREGVRARLLTINETKCQPPLALAEVEAIADQAMSYPVEGVLGLTRQELNSEPYRKASHAARSLYLEARQQFDGSNNGKISLTLRELAARGFTHPKTLAKLKRECLSLGLLSETRRARYGKLGQHRECALYGLPLVAENATKQNAF